MTKVCICGGGSLAHVYAGVLSSLPDVEVWNTMKTMMQKA